MTQPDLFQSHRDALQRELDRAKARCNTREVNASLAALKQATTDALRAGI